MYKRKHIYDERRKDKLDKYLRLQLRDNVLAYKIKNNGEYEKIHTNEKKIDSKKNIEEYVSKIYKTLKKDTDQSRATHLASKLFKEN